MLRLLTVVAALFIALLLSVAPAQAQTSESASSPLSPVTISVDGGLSAASRGNGGAIGAQLTVALNDRLVLEADGSHLGSGHGTGAMSGAMSGTIALLVNLVPSGGKTVPYLAVGGGLYRASFNLDDERYFGRLSGQLPGGTQMIPIAGMHGFGMMQGAYTGPSTWSGPWPGSTFSPNHMPTFYVDRLGRMMVPDNGRWGWRSFNDPAISVGAGVRLAVSPRFYVRPDARVLVVIANRSSYTVGVVTLGVGYRF